MKYIHICDDVICGHLEQNQTFLHVCVPTFFFQLRVDINLKNNAPRNLDICKHDVGVSIKPISYSYRIFSKNKIISPV